MSNICGGKEGVLQESLDQITRVKRSHKVTDSIESFSSHIERIQVCIQDVYILHVQTDMQTRWPMAPCNLSWLVPSNRSCSAARKEIGLGSKTKDGSMTTAKCARRQQVADALPPCRYQQWWQMGLASGSWERVWQDSGGSIVLLVSAMCSRKIVQNFLRKSLMLGMFLCRQSVAKACPSADIGAGSRVPRAH